VTVGNPSVRPIARSRSAEAAPSDDDGVEVAFSLPGGAYATAVMREVMKSS
jgi:tRNA(Glu) U13 pseudouridine synthase TruD